MSEVNTGGRPVRLLMMSAGSLVVTSVLECIDEMGRDGFELIGLNTEADVVNNFRMDVCYLSPPAREQAALLALLDELVAQHDPDLIIPGRDDDVVALAHWAQGKPQSRALVGCVEMAEVIRDKWASYQWAMKKGLPFARSAISTSGVQELIADIGFPLVAKPRDGFGSNGVRMLLDDDHVNAVLALGNQVIQEPVSPAPMLTPEIIKSGMPLWFAPVQRGSACVLCLLGDEGFDFLAAWISNGIRGAAFETTLLDDPPLKALALRYAEAAWTDGWRGLLNFQARPDAAGNYVPIELAGRFMGGTNAVNRLGVPLVAMVLKHFVPAFHSQTPVAPLYGARAIKQVTTHLIYPEQEKSLRETGVWKPETTQG